jgi:hypothetical protein
MEEWKYISNFLDLGTSRICVVSLTPRPIYARLKSPKHPLDRRLLCDVGHEITNGGL